MQREDGRNNLQHRRIGVEIDRDVVFSFGLTKIHTMLDYASQLKKGVIAKVIIEESALPPTVSKVRREKMVEEIEKTVESIFENAILDKENSYTVICRVLCDNGSMLSAIINSVSLVLLSYKVSIRYMIFSATVGLSLHRHLEYIVDLIDAEERSDTPYITLAMPYTDRDRLVSYGSLSRPLSEKAFLDLMEYATGVLVGISEEIMEKTKSHKI
ncbi:hypothetical protein NEMIN01_1274 [Nematocida minor]|uniref:uncharacterized protein n=1 Tax=Nematocida minor TaxID=1912983 RepID=UPI002220C9EA|nr:uncharacterized protein NEMIN01_1274 [Nematocida minor]KAI5190941.1 hypothetical protein NEMIN01_1274 [Nematocida minor]